MKKVLLVGNGAREHAIAMALTKTGRVELTTYAKARNPGIASVSKHYVLGSLSDFEALKKCALECAPDFAVIGPDDPIADGAADILLTLGIRSVAPLKILARLESSKSFTRDLVEKYGVPGNPKYKVFLTADESAMKAFVKELGGEYVVKADGLMGGKGVVVSGEHVKTVEEGIAFAKASIEKFGRVVIEEKFVGQEFSLMSFVDGNTVIDMPVVQDHKRAYEGDTGPNTGGMGTYSDANHMLPFLTSDDVAQAHEITVQMMHALKKETGNDYKGIMYGGFIAVKNGVRLIEYNARFGDPEALNVLPLLKTDFVDVCEHIIEGTLRDLTVEFEHKATVCKYIVPEGYPEKSKAGEKIVVSDEQPIAENNGDRLVRFYSSIDQKDDGLYLSTSRAIAFTGVADTLAQAEAIAEKACSSVDGPVFHRRDIGTEKLIQKRIESMNRLRAQ